MGRLVERRRADVLARAQQDLGDRGAGAVTRVRLTIGFFEGELALLVMKLPDGYVWREDPPQLSHRKGWHPPAWRHV